MQWLAFLLHHRGLEVRSSTKAKGMSAIHLGLGFGSTLQVFHSMKRLTLGLVLHTREIKMNKIIPVPRELTI